MRQEVADTMLAMVEQALGRADALDKEEKESDYDLYHVAVCELRGLAASVRAVAQANRPKDPPAADGDKGMPFLRALLDVSDNLYDDVNQACGDEATEDVEVLLAEYYQLAIGACRQIDAICATLGLAPDNKIKKETKA